MSLVADSFSSLVVSGKEPDAEAIEKLNVFENDNTLGDILQSVRTAHAKSRQELQVATKRYVEAAKVHRGEPSIQQVKLLNDYKATQVKLAVLRELKVCREKLSVLRQHVEQQETQKALEAHKELTEAIGQMKQYSEVKIVRALSSEADNLFAQIEEEQMAKWSKAVEVTQTQVAVGDDAGTEFQLLGSIGDGVQKKSLGQLVKSLDGVFERLLDLQVQVKSDSQSRVSIAPEACSTLPQFSDSLIALVTVINTLPKDVSAPVIKRLSTPVTNKLLQSLGKLIPDSVDGLPAFEAHLDLLETLEEKLTSFGWLSGDEITDWSFSLPEVWLSARKDKFLAELRTRLLSGAVENISDEKKTTPRPPSKAQESPKKPRTASHSTTGSRQVRKSQSQASLAPSEGSADNWGDDDLEFSDEEKETKEDWGWDEPITEETAEEAKSVAAESTAESNEDWGWGDETDVVIDDNEGDVTVEATTTATPADVAIITTNLPEILTSTITSFLNEGSHLYEERKKLKIGSAGFMYPSQTANFYALYRALVPLAYRSAKSPLALYNDIETINNHIRAQKDEAELAAELELMDKFGKRHLRQVLEQHQSHITDILNGAGGFQNCSHEGGNLFNCQAAAEKLTSYLTQLSDEWEDQVSDNARMQMLGTLLNCAATTIVTEVENLGDISEAESQELAKLVAVISAGVESLFGEALTATFCQNWLKFEYLGQILESNLADIRYLLESDALVDYSADELVSLVHALFSDSERREKLISDIYRKGSQ
ncbi:YALIA101S08e04588g1_1 [Yarrowia lipolytica]|jgi:centromere/kinetochore protein ZW10|nr:Hypothetical protein YALI2_A00571g [Yarrowia lipolytica]SEI35822.1 YALIA101S08e04588g1_1 [Yarrowia lipolytica]VBB88719.1 Conserved hypothetical protein [Yarrowia lipolytica]